MFLKGRFIEWTRAHVIGSISMLFVVLIVLFAWINIGVGPTQEVTGTVRNIGMDTATIYTLSRIMATIETESGEKILIEIPTSVVVSKGSDIIVGKTPRLLTNGYEYNFLRVAK